MVLAHVKCSDVADVVERVIQHEVVFLPKQRTEHVFLNFVLCSRVAPNTNLLEVAGKVFVVVASIVSHGEIQSSQALCGAHCACFDPQAVDEPASLVVGIESSIE